jgi:5-methylcytosine-specific restriction endonuclease McrA
MCGRGGVELVAATAVAGHIVQMAKSTPALSGTCVYCGETKPLSADHVPPKNLFDRPYPANLLTVPACVDCNGAFSKDDEDFRIALTVTD